jgi:hypothetical protein
MIASDMPLGTVNNTEKVLAFRTRDKTKNK